MIDFDNMLAGPKLNAYVAEKVLGLEVCWKPRPGFIQQTKYPFVLVNLPTGIGPPENPRGSTWIECSDFSNSSSVNQATWQVVEKIISRKGWDVIIESVGWLGSRPGRRRRCTFFNGWRVAMCAYASTVQLAVCRAASKVVASEEWADGSSE